MRGNLFFYAKWGLIYLLLIPGAAISDFLIGRAIFRSQNPRIRRSLISLSLLLNIGLIVSGKTKGLVLPLSLSFYAFQALTYTIDIYRKDAQPCRSYLQYLASVSFFPTALAGPITRVSSLIPQWNWKGVVLTGEEGSRALFLIGLGLAKKFLIADYLGDHLVNRVFDCRSSIPAAMSWSPSMRYAFQLYYDFPVTAISRIGAGAVAGHSAARELQRPYRSLNIADFWRRWHMSFSFWLRDYLYFSLPGPRTRSHALRQPDHHHGARRPVARVELDVPDLGPASRQRPGGVPALAAHARKGRGQSASRVRRFAGSLLTFHFVLLTWIFFRAANVETALKILSQIANFRFSFDNTTPAFVFVLLAGAALHFIPKSWYDGSIIGFSRAPALVQSAALALLVLAIQRVAASGAAPFIYTRF